MAGTDIRTGNDNIVGAKSPQNTLPGNRDGRPLRKGGTAGDDHELTDDAGVRQIPQTAALFGPVRQKPDKGTEYDQDAEKDKEIACRQRNDFV